MGVNNSLSLIKITHQLRPIKNWMIILSRQMCSILKRWWAKIRHRMKIWLHRKIIHKRRLSTQYKKEVKLAAIQQIKGFYNLKRLCERVWFEICRKFQSINRNLVMLNNLRYSSKKKRELPAPEVSVTGWYPLRRARSIRLATSSWQRAERMLPTST